MKRAKFAPVTAALLARKGEARNWDDGNAHAEAAPETVGFLSGSFGRPPKDVANVTDYERLGRLIAAKCDTTRQYDSPENRPHFANGATKAESAQLVSKWVWLKAVWSGFQAFGHGPRL
jgi:hypothetical protein